MTSQHLGLGVDHLADINAEPRSNIPAQGVLPLNGIPVIQIRNLLQGSRVSLIAEEVRHRRSKAGRPGDVTGHLMIRHVVGRAVGHDHARLHLPKESRGSFQCSFIIKDE
jgi:hypothetical protein